MPAALSNDWTAFLVSLDQARSEGDAAIARARDSVHAAEEALAASSHRSASR